MAISYLFSYIMINFFISFKTFDINVAIKNTNTGTIKNLLIRYYPPFNDIFVLFYVELTGKEIA